MFSHKDGDGFDLILQAMPLDGKIVCREIAEEAPEEGSPARDRQDATRGCPGARRRSAERIRELNDAFRRTFIGGNVVMTTGIAALSDETRAS